MKAAGELTTKQAQFLAALLTTPNIEAAAKQAGLSPVTAWRLMKQPAFQVAYREAKRELVQHATTLLQRLATTAVSTLGQIMVDREAPPSSRVAAAKVVLEMALRGVELEDILLRIEALEMAQGQGR